MDEDYYDEGTALFKKLRHIYYLNTDFRVARQTNVCHSKQAEKEEIQY